MNPFDKKVPQPQSITGVNGKVLRPKLKEASKKALEAKRQTKEQQKDDFPFQDFMKTKQPLTREFILRNAIFWSEKESSMARIRSLVLRDM